MGRHAGPYDPDPGSQTDKALITNRGQFGQPANEGQKSGSNVVFPEIKNVSRVTGNCRQVEGGTQPLDFGKTT